MWIYFMNMQMYPHMSLSNMAGRMIKTKGGSWHLPAVFLDFSSHFEQNPKSLAWLNKPCAATTHLLLHSRWFLCSLGWASCHPALFGWLHPHVFTGQLCTGFEALLTGMSVEKVFLASLHLEFCCHSTFWINSYHIKCLGVYLHLSSTLELKSH